MASNRNFRRLVYAFGDPRGLDDVFYFAFAPDNEAWTMTEVLPGSLESPPPVARRRLEIGALAPATWRMFTARPVTFYMLSFIPLAISFAVGLVQGVSKGHNDTQAFTVIATIVQTVLQLVCQNATMYGTARVADGARFGLGEAISVGARRFFPCLGATLLASLVIALGLVALIVPGLIAACALGLAGTACVVERRGPIASLSRSADLTRGNRWRVLAAMLLLILLPAVILIAVFAIGAVALSSLHLPILVILTGILAVLLYPLIFVVWLIFVTVLFLELRALREGRGPSEALSRVFE